MGHGHYSAAAHAALMAGRAHLSGTEVFVQRQCHPLMNPKGLKVRECRDSADHPESIGIAFALDVTGSMGDIPHLLATRELPNFMKLLNACGVAHPEVMFMAIGDATSDQAPLQVGQFESTAQLMDQWLTWSYLEGGGGGSNHESYDLAFYIAAQHTDMDNWVKRKKKGYLFLTGDELPYPAVSRIQIEALIGEKLDEDIPLEEVIAAAAETYHLFFLIPDLVRGKRCEARWRELLGNHCICMESPADTCAVAAAIVGLTENLIADTAAVGEILSRNGFDREHVGSTIRAVQEYAALLKTPSSKPRYATSAKPSGKWWKRLFENDSA
ncbi:MAG TPA: VWA domain-containing protein [Verrucomicrobiae bacterium]|nr:VWA domain-containing protein [Verrucomicrobiae bacterium]